MTKYELEEFGAMLRETMTADDDDTAFAYLLGRLDGVQEITDRLEAADRDNRS